ncbi:hypothetical protein BU17DRAFT_92159 [Hysterangium stoloniferum]|nr:hypothetical protein BU17DRAFT_92159 [Hysterangium stoloniferum]
MLLQFEPWRCVPPLPALFTSAWDYKLGPVLKAQRLERITLAHSCAALSMDCPQGVMTDIAFSSTDTLQALHTSGTFAQYALRLYQCNGDPKPSSPLLYNPLDAVPLVAMTWPPNNDVACVADRKEEELPGDDLPAPFSLTKATSDPSYIPKEQTLRTMSLSDFGFDTRTMRRLVRAMIDVCEINAKVGRISPDFRDLDWEPLYIHRAAEESQSNAERVWKVMAGLLGVKTKTVIS